MTILATIRMKIRPYRYLGAAALVLLALGIRFAIGNALAGYPYLTFYPIVAVAAVVCGWKSGAFASVLSLLIAWFFFVPEVWSFQLVSLSDGIALIGFAVFAPSIVFMVALLEQEERRRTEAAQQADLLFRELKHRVANVLQLSASLLTFRSRQTNSEASTALLEAATQIKLIAAFHERIAAANGNVSIVEPLKELCQTVTNLAPGVRCDVRCDAISLHSDTVLPLALVIHELLTNAIEHAYDDPSQGRLSVSVEQLDGALQIEIADDGRGLPGGFAIANSSRQGLHLVNALVRQMGGTFTLLPRSPAPGTMARIRLPAGSAKVH